jgi:hypothetical protein
VRPEEPEKRLETINSLDPLPSSDESELAERAASRDNEFALDLKSSSDCRTKREAGNPLEFPPAAIPTKPALALRGNESAKSPDCEKSTDFRPQGEKENMLESRNSVDGLKWQDTPAANEARGRADT